jgi:diketogulonate reductase-like aldo/keto reductase
LSNPNRIAENAAILDFHLTQSEVERLCELG